MVVSNLEIIARMYSSSERGLPFFVLVRRANGRHYTCQCDGAEAVRAWAESCKAGDELVVLERRGNQTHTVTGEFISRI